MIWISALFSPLAFFSLLVEHEKILKARIFGFLDDVANTMKENLQVKFVSLVLSLAFSQIAFASDSVRTLDENVQNVDHGCGYMQRVRDGLHPYQYFCLAKVYLSDFRLELARVCIEKLNACKGAQENAQLVSILEESYLPKHPVAEAALEQVNKAADLMVLGRMGDSEKVAERKAICRELIAKYPNFEWSYFLESTDGPLMGSNSSKIALKKVLSINPKNVEALANLAEVYRGDQWTEAFQNASKAKDLDPGRSGIDVEFYADVVAKQNGKRKDRDCPEERNRKKPGKRQPSSSELSEKRYVEKAYKFIDKTGKKVFYVGPNVNVADQFSDDLLLVNGSDGRGSYQSNDVQYWNKTGDLAFSFSHGDALSSTEGSCAVQKDDEVGRTRWGFVDHQGNTLIQPRYSQVIPFRNGLSAVKVSVSRPFFMNDKWGFVSRNGSLQIEPIYDNCLSFEEGLAPVSINGKVGFINKDGYFEIPPKFDYARPFSEGLSNVLSWDAKKRTMTEQYIDRTGVVAFSNEVRIAENQSASDFFSISDYVYPEQLSFRVGDSVRYRWSDFHDGLVARRKLVKPKVWKAGFADATGRFVILPVFDEVEAFSEGLAKVKLGDKYGYVNTKGERVIPATYREAKDFTEGMAAVSTDGTSWGYIDKSGKVVISEKYLEANSFSNGLAKVGVEK